MGIEDDFYATIKLNSGEEVFAKVAASEEEDRTMLILHTPVTKLRSPQSREERQASLKIVEKLFSLIEEDKNS